ncbi:MAG: dihydrofolate reductase [Neisseriales bacterium]|nr:MAG: dihydrofolate reductase [Neisseriales bacterium]
MTKIILIAAIADNNVIGLNNHIPWHIPEDLKHFKAATTGKVVVMGRRTYESIGEKPLPNRKNVVVTHQVTWRSKGVEVAHGVEEAFNLLKNESIIYVIGGAKIYEASLPFAHELCLTKIGLQVAGDTFFPVFDVAYWQESKRLSGQSSSGVIYHIVNYIRRDDLPSCQQIE